MTDGYYGYGVGEYQGLEGIFGDIWGGIKSVAGRLPTAAAATLTAGPVAGAAHLVTGARAQREAQAAYPTVGTQPIRAPSASFDVEELWRALKGEALQAAGQYIAQTPEGQAGIKREIATRAGAAAQTVSPWLIGAGVLALLVFTGRK